MLSSLRKRRRIHPVLRVMTVIIAVIALAMVIGEFTLERPHWNFMVAGFLLACLFIYSGITGWSPWFWD